jgi:hypothetical protein
MSEVISLRPAAVEGDGYGHRDVVIDRDGVWSQRTERPNWWRGFDGLLAHADNLPQPWTLVARAGETTDLKRARDAQIAVVEENGELRDAHRRIAGYERATAEEFMTAGWSTPPTGDHHHAAAISTAVLARTDPLRGDA